MAKKNDPVKTAFLFEFYVKRIWPLQRKFVGQTIAKRCVKCAASEKMRSLNSSQVCSDCTTYTPVEAPKKGVDPKINQELNAVFSEHQNKSKGSHDILIMFSGGKDSCYMVQRIKNEFPKMRILTCSIDNNFMSSVAKNNISEVLPKLNVDHIFLRPKIEFNRNLFRTTLTNLNSDGCYGTVDFSDGEFMLDSAKKLAQERGIPLIACGYSKIQVQNGLKLNTFESPPEKERPARTSVAGLELKKFFKAEEVQMWWNEENSKAAFLPRLIFPLFVWDLEEDEIKREVVNWGLISKKNQSPIVTNHQLIPLLGVVDVHQLGYSSFEPEFCRMIREGKADRKQWLHTFEFLEYTARTGFLVKPVVMDLLKLLDLTADQVRIKF